MRAKMRDTLLQCVPKNDPARRLYALIEAQTSDENIVTEILKWSEKVADGEEPPDCCNSCDGDGSILSAFCLWNLTAHYKYLGLLSRVSVRNHRQWKWILTEFNFEMWKQPLRFEPHMIQFIKHPIVGRHFTFYGGAWLGCDYYECMFMDVELIEEVCVKCLETYKQFYGLPLTYINQCVEHLHFRKLWREDSVLVKYLRESLSK